MPQIDPARHVQEFARLLSSKLERVIVEREMVRRVPGVYVCVWDFCLNVGQSCMYEVLFNVCMFEVLLNVVSLIYLFSRGI